MTTPIGIDLGTTNSAVAQVDDSGQAGIIGNAEGHSITPSVISFLPDRIVIGDEAKDLQAAGVGDVAAFFKRQMGDPQFLFEAQGRDWSAGDLSALLLQHLREDAEQTLGTPVRQAVITVPAYFRNPQREATRSAGEQADIEVLQLINEPTAAAIAYGVRKGVEHAGKTLLVYDLGGGTFDLTLLRIDEKEIRVLNSEGDHELGGKDWDDRIVQFLATRFEEEFGADPFADALSLTSLLTQAEQAKRQLTNTQSASLAITHDGRRARYSISRSDFEGLTADLVDRTISLTNKVLADAEVSPNQLEGTILVGGSTRMPMVHGFIQRNFGHAPLGGVNVDEAVALGAALLAAQSRQASPVFTIGGRRTVDVTNHSLGMVAENPDRSAYVNSIILPKNKAIPSKEQRPYQFHTGEDGRLEIFMTQGESEQPDQVTYLGLYIVDTATVGQKSRQAVIDIEYAYDSSGTVQVAAGLRGGGSLPVGVEPLPDDVPSRFLSPPPPLPQPVHITVYLAFDLSGSMSGDPLVEAKKAAHGFIDNLDLGHASVGIIAVADQVKTVLKACQNGRKIAKAIDSLEIGMVGIGNHQHPFDEAQSLMGLIKDPTYLVVLADGIWYDQDKAIEQAKRCHQAAIDVIAIGFGSADQGFLQAIASSDEAGILTNIGGLVDTFSTIAQVLTENTGTGFSLKGRK